MFHIYLSHIPSITYFFLSPFNFVSIKYHMSHSINQLYWLIITMTHHITNSSKITFLSLRVKSINMKRGLRQPHQMFAVFNVEDHQIRLCSWEFDWLNSVQKHSSLYTRELMTCMHMLWCSSIPKAKNSYYYCIP